MSDDIIVTGPSPYTPPFEPPATPQSPPGGPPPPGSPGGPPDPALEGIATDFASARVRVLESVDESDPEELAWINQSNQILKGLYFNTQFGSKTTINGPGEEDISEGMLAQSLMKTTISLTTDFVSNSGAKAVAYSNGQYEIQIDIDHPNITDFVNGFGENGMNFVVFHEIGHILGHARGDPVSEPDASTYALGIADYAYFGIPTQAALEAVDIDFSPF